MQMTDRHVVVTGLPGSGKTTTAQALSIELGRPMIAKDEIREHIFAELGSGDTAWRSAVGRAAVNIQFDLMRRLPALVVDSGLWTDLSEDPLHALGRPLLQVFCECPFELARERVAKRKRWDTASAVAEYERFRPLIEPLRLRAPLIRVDTSHPADFKVLAKEIRILENHGCEQDEPRNQRP